MNEALILGGIVLVLWVGLFLLRVPTSIAFLSLLIGQLLSTEASEDVYEFVASVLNIARIEYIKAVLLILPLLLTIGFLRNRVPKPKMLIELIPTLFIVSLTLVLIGPFIQPLQNLMEAATHDQLEAYKSIIVVAASISGLLSGWLSYPKPPKDHHGKHH